MCLDALGCARVEQGGEQTQTAKGTEVPRGFRCKYCGYFGKTYKYHHIYISRLKNRQRAGPSRVGCAACSPESAAGRNGTGDVVCTREASAKRPNPRQDEPGLSQPSSLFQQAQPFGKINSTGLEYEKLDVMPTDRI